LEGIVEKQKVWVEMRADGKWIVREIGGHGEIGLWETQAEAARAGLDYAKQHDAEVVIQDTSDYQYHEVDEEAVSDDLKDD
jgi:hypothetical protein